MNQRLYRTAVARAIALGLMLLAGCASAVAVGQNTALDSTDLVTMTDDMSARILASPAVQQAIAREGSLKVVVEPVVNDMRAEVLPRGPADAFTARLRTLLAHHAPGEFTWIMNRDAFYALRNAELSPTDPARIDPGPSPDAINPRYALTATFTSLANENTAARTDYYVCSYSLTDLSTRVVLWTGDYEVKKRAVKGFLD
jgi:hypothetical protein